MPPEMIYRPPRNTYARVAIISSAIASSSAPSPPSSSSGCNPSHETAGPKKASYNNSWQERGMTRISCTATGTALIECIAYAHMLIITISCIVIVFVWLSAFLLGISSVKLR